jgi:hypothetical protein
MRIFLMASCREEPWAQRRNFMNRVTSDPTSAGGKIFSYVWLILAANFLAGSVHATTPATEIETGIKGQVMMGPITPGPAVVGAADEAPFRAVFQVFDAESKLVTRFKSDENGNFTVPLPPGNYTIVPDKSAPFPYPGQQRKTVKVPEGGFADVVLRFDSGMR